MTDHGHHDGSNGPLHISLTLPGSASLGAFQAGAASAIGVLIQALRDLGRDVRVDALGGASAGSLVGLLWAHCVLTGRDATSLLYEAWVEEVDAELLRSGGNESPLAFDDLRDQLVDFLEDSDQHPFGAHRPLDGRMLVQVSLTSLLGLTTPTVITSGRSELITYADHVEFRLDSGHDVDALFRPEGTSLLDAALASASNPAAFPPRTLDRSDADEHFEQLGVEDPPDDRSLWYTDGGLVESQPVGRVLDAARRNGGSSQEGTRLHLVLDPRSSGPSGSSKWADSTASHHWLDGVQRALSILPTQALHDDLRRIAERNARIENVRELVRDLRDAGVDGGEWAERIAWVADVAGQEPVDVDIISPRLLARDDDEGVSDLLAGDFVGAFGGFLSIDLRRNDFALGWRATELWAEDGLFDHGIDEDDAAEIGERLEDARPDDWQQVKQEGEGIEQLEWHERWQLVLLAAQIGRVLTAQAIPSPLAAVRRWGGR